ncbi:MAG: hypothetical protein HY288_10450 [Planctomycetia bacterium]|nr:hypothetical protein [Planctomycetia bacterium]
MADFRDFSPTASNWLVRAYYTPLGDALRGRLSARLDVRQEIAAAELPAPLSGLIYTVVRGSRLWRGEKIDVARELIAHFADGLGAGRSAEELVRDFGSPKQAAKLIRRAKLRRRPLWWQCGRILSRLFAAAIAAILLGYAALSARFYLGKPQIIHNYWNEINAARRVPEADRAWPLYRTAAIKLGKTHVDSAWIDDGPMGKHWDEAVAALERHRESLDLIRQGAKKPRLGYLLGDRADLEAARAANSDWPMTESSPLAEANQDLISALLPGIQEMRRLTRLLAADARRAAIVGDGAAVVADLTTMISISEQIFAPDASLVEQLVGMAIFEIAVDATWRILADAPQVLSDEQLRDLAHRIATYRSGSLAVDFRSEELLFDDLLQRAYTDDGHGNGRITPAGLTMLAGENYHLTLLAALDPGKSGVAANNLARVLSPGVGALIGSRQENRELYRSLMDVMIAAHQGPPWEWDRQAIDAPDSRLKSALASPASRYRYLPVALMFPAREAAYSANDRSIQIRDAAEVAIALEFWHRRHGHWPASLAQLVPDLLPAVPPDRYDGQPLRYVVRDGRPVVYSIGVDRNDDGGRPTVQAELAYIGGYGRLAPEALERLQSSHSDGDWILWPPVKEDRQ